MTLSSLERKPDTGIQSALTVERLLYGLFFLIGAGLRFYGLGKSPLTPLEAAQSWPVWLDATGQSVGGAPLEASALLATLQAAVFWITQGGDGAARVMSATAGTALLLMPWLLRPWLGRTTALALALLFAIDPWLVTFSRLADGAIFSTALALLGLTSLARLSLPQIAEPGLRAWLLTAAAAVGLLLVSGSLAWSYLPLLLLFGALLVWPALSATERQALRRQLPGALVVLVAAALLGATAWLARPSGLSAVGRSLSEWLTQFSPGAYPLSWTLARLLADQPFALVFGAIGLAALWRQRRNLSTPPGAVWPLFLTVWLLWGIFWQILPGRTPGALLVLGVPLLFAAAHAGALLLDRTPRTLDWRAAGVLLVSLTVLLTAGRIALNVLLAAPGFDLDVALILLLIGVGAMLIVVAVALWSDRGQTLWLTGVFAAVTLLLATGASTWQLAHGQSVQRPSGLFAVMTHPNVRTLQEDLATVSAQRRGDAMAKPVQVQMTAAPDPVLGWYLRDRRVVDWVLAPDFGATNAPPMLLTLAPAMDGDPEQSGAPPGFIGSDYDIRYGWLPSELLDAPLPDAPPVADGDWRQAVEGRLAGPWQARIQPWLRWLLHDSVADAPRRTGVQLWVLPEE